MDANKRDIAETLSAVAVMSEWGRVTTYAAALRRCPIGE